METLERIERIRDAEGTINKILANLERITDSLVDEIEIRKFEVTTLGSDRPMWRRSVRINMERRPGAGWVE